MTSTSLTCPALTGGAFPRCYDVAHNHREAAKTSSRRRTAPSTPIAGLQSVRCHRSNQHVHGFTRAMLARLVRAGLAIAGRRWLEDAAKSELRGPNRFKDFWRG